MHEIAFRPEAEAEASEAFAWYDSKRSGLGDEFLLALDAVVAAIQRNPEQYPVLRSTVRRAVMHRFPYGVFYTVDADRVVVIAVFHGRKNPTRWHGRV